MSRNTRHTHPSILRTVLTRHLAPIAQSHSGVNSDDHDALKCALNLPIIAAAGRQVLCWSLGGGWERGGWCGVFF